MNPEDLTLKALRSDVRYRGNFKENAWELLTGPVRLYRTMLKHLGPFGATLQTFKIETPSLADANVSCTLLELNTVVRIRLNGFEYDCGKLNEVGIEGAKRILCAIWAAIHEADDSIELGTHLLDLNIVAEIVGATSSRLLSRYLRIPESLGPMDAGVAFYTRPVKGDAETWINLVLDRVFQEDGQIIIKTTLGCAASEVRIDGIGEAAEDQINRMLDGLGLRLQTEQ